MQIDEWNSVADSVDFNLKIDIDNFTSLVTRDQRVIDFGCGYGRVTDLLHREGYSQTIGVDTSGEMIARGVASYPHLMLKHVGHGDLDYPDNHFDAAVICAVLTCIPDKQDKIVVLSEVHRLIKPGGTLHLVEFCSDESKKFISKMGVRMHHQARSEYDDLLSSFEHIDSAVIMTETMSGDGVNAYSYFGRSR